MFLQKTKEKVEDIISWRKPFQTLHGHDKYYLKSHKKASIRVAMVILECYISYFRHAVTI